MNNFIEYCKLLRQHVASKEETSEEVLEKMDEIWYSFNEDEMHAMREFNAQWVEHPQWQMFAMRIYENLKKDKENK